MLSQQDSMAICCSCILLPSRGASKAWGETACRGRYRERGARTAPEHCIAAVSIWRRSLQAMSFTNDARPFC